MNLVFQRHHHYKIPSGTLSTVALNTQGVWKVCDFRPISLFISETVRDRLMITIDRSLLNRKSADRFVSVPMTMSNRERRDVMGHIFRWNSSMTTRAYGLTVNKLLVTMLYVHTTAKLLRESPTREPNRKRPSSVLTKSRCDFPRSIRPTRV